VPVVGEKDPSGEVKRVQCPRPVEGSRHEGEIRLSELLSSPQQAHDDQETSIGKKSTPEFRHRDRIRHGGDNSYGKDADRRVGGPRYLLSTETVNDARLAVRLVSQDGDVIWSTTQESTGAKFKGASADVADKVAKQLLRDIDKATPPKM